MNLNRNRHLRLSTIAALALATVPTVPTIALVAGQSFDRCESVEFQGNRIDAGETRFDGYIDVVSHGRIALQCTTSDGVVTRMDPLRRQRPHPSRRHR